MEPALSAPKCYHQHLHYRKPCSEQPLGKPGCYLGYETQPTAVNGGAPRRTGPASRIKGKDVTFAIAPFTARHESVGGDVLLTLQSKVTN